MATTDAQLIAWLKSDTAKRCVLIKATVQPASGGADIIRKLSNKNYADYLPVVGGGVTFTEALSLEGVASLSSGTIDLDNINGEIDSWLDDVWQNRPIQIYIGDEFWVEEDFYLIFDGVIAEQPDAEDRRKLSLTLSDKLQRLNTTVTDVKLGGDSPEKDKLIPLLFGEGFNLSPLLVSKADHEYQIHNGPIERIIEVRDNGIPVGFTPYLSTGKFRLTQQPVGTITCDAQGDKSAVYVNDVVGTIKRLVKDFGNAASRFTDAELFLTTNLSTTLPGNGNRILATQRAADGDKVLETQTASGAVVASGSAAIGLYLTEKANLLDVCNQLASSIGARVAMTRAGLLYVVRINLPQASMGTMVTAADMRERSLTCSTAPVVAAVQLGYCKNYTVQTNIAEGAPADQIKLYAQEGFTETNSDAAVATKFKLISNPTTQWTLLQVTLDAQQEAARRQMLLGTQRKVVKFVGLQHLMLESLGGSMTIEHRRFGLSVPKTGQILNVVTNWLKATVEIGVFL